MDLGYRQHSGRRIYVIVYVRDAATKSYVAKNYMSYGIVIVPPAAWVRHLPPACQVLRLPGRAITFTAGGSGGSESYEYKFLLKTGSTWSVVQDYSTSNTFAWNTAGLAAGTYSWRFMCGMWVRQCPMKHLNLSATTSSPVAPATGADANCQRPQSSGRWGPSLRLTAEGSGGSGSYEYKFLLRQLLGATLDSGPGVLDSEHLCLEYRRAGARHIHHDGLCAECGVSSAL